MKLSINNKFANRSIELDLNNENIEVKGLRDSHCHLVWLGIQELGLNLENCQTFEQLISKSVNYSQTNQNTWLIGRGWNDETWESNIKYIKELDKYFPNIPVYLKRIDGHAAIVNSKTLQLCNISKSTSNPEGGKILKDKEGNLTGYLVDNAMELVNDKTPNYSDDELINYILKAQEICLNFGLYEVHDMDVHLEWLPIFEYLANENKFDLKVKSYIRGFDRKFLENSIKPHKINNLNISGIKFYSDGAIGSRGAALIEDYSDEPGNKGIFLVDENDFFEIAKNGASIGFEIGTHAIGDMANRFTLNVYEKLRGLGINVPLRIEHSQMVHPDDLIRYKELKIDSAIQPIHCISDEKMAEKRLGNRVSYSYPWKSLYDLGINISGGSDFPIESPDPLLGIKALVSPNISWQEKEKVDIETALKIYGAI